MPALEASFLKADKAAANRWLASGAKSKQRSHNIHGRKNSWASPAVTLEKTGSSLDVSQKEPRPHGSKCELVGAALLKNHFKPASAASRYFGLPESSLKV